MATSFLTTAERDALNGYVPSFGTVGADLDSVAPATVPAPPIYPLAFILDCLTGEPDDSNESEWYWDGFPESYAQWSRAAWGTRFIAPYADNALFLS